jgi:hypothetical protein
MREKRNQRTSTTARTIRARQSAFGSPKQGLSAGEKILEIRRVDLKKRKFLSPGIIVDWERLTVFM